MWGSALLITGYNLKQWCILPTDVTQCKTLTKETHKQKIKNKETEWCSIPSPSPLQLSALQWHNTMVTYNGIWTWYIYIIHASTDRWQWFKKEANSVLDLMPLQGLSCSCCGVLQSRGEGRRELLAPVNLHTHQIKCPLLDIWFGFVLATPTELKCWLRDVQLILCNFKLLYHSPTT